MSGKKSMEAESAVPSIAEIEEFVLASGSDHLPTFGGRFEGGIHCQQVADEIAPAIHAILSSGIVVDRYLEIGVAAGGTTFLMHHFLRPDSIVLVDDNAHWKAGQRDGILAGVGRSEVIGNSRSPEVIAKADELGPYQVMVIDGDHTYPGVRADADNYLPMLQPGGFLVFHDSALPEWGVLRVTSELKEDERLEFVSEYLSAKHSRPLGVAVFRKK